MASEENTLDNLGDPVIAESQGFDNPPHPFPVFDDFPDERDFRHGLIRLQDRVISFFR